MYTTSLTFDLTSDQEKLEEEAGHISRAMASDPARSNGPYELYFHTFNAPKN